MKDAFGGIFSVFLIGVFLLIVEGILGLVVSYSKTFRMKNIIISSYERFEGAGNCEEHTDCYRRIAEQAKNLHYSKNQNITCSSSDYTLVGNDDGPSFCYKSTISPSENNCIYTVELQLDISFPIVEKIMGLSFLKVRGDTRVIKGRCRA